MGAVGTSNDAQAETAVAPPFRAHRSPRHSRPEFDGSQSSPAGRTVGYIFQRSCKTQAERDHLVPFSGPSGRAQLCSARRGNFSAAAVSAATRRLRRGARHAGARFLPVRPPHLLPPDVWHLGPSARGASRRALGRLRRKRSAVPRAPAAVPITVWQKCGTHSPGSRTKWSSMESSLDHGPKRGLRAEASGRRGTTFPCYAGKWRRAVPGRLISSGWLPRVCGGD